MLVTLTGVVVVANFMGGEKKIQQRVERHYQLDDPRFLNELIDISLSDGHFHYYADMPELTYVTHHACINLCAPPFPPGRRRSRATQTAGGYRAMFAGIIGNRVTS